jgi:hypothetical protein
VEARQLFSSIVRHDEYEALGRNGLRLIANDTDFILNDATIMLYDSDVTVFLRRARMA